MVEFRKNSGNKKELNAIASPGKNRTDPKHKNGKNPAKCPTLIAKATADALSLIAQLNKKTIVVKGPGI